MTRILSVLFRPDQPLGGNTAVLQLGMSRDDCVVFDPHRPGGRLAPRELRDAKTLDAAPAGSARASRSIGCTHCRRSPLPSIDVKLLRRRSVAPEPESTSEEPTSDVVAGKGRPTPKRRDTTPQRGPLNAPRTRKEAVQWQKQQAARSRTTGRSGKLSGQAYREALRRGDPDALPKRDRGPVRKLARDWVDSRRMLSNFMLILFPLLIVGYFIPYLNIAVFALLIVIVAEWYLAGRRIRALAVSRLDDVREGPWALGFYAGSRAYMPRRWRMPSPQVAVGDSI